jgi:photosystem II stability/assembly factor-like uncharacterized protein
VSVVAPPRPPDTEDLEALIEEARRRARRRRIGYGLGLLLLATALGLYFGLGHGGGAGGNRHAARGPGAGTPAAEARQIARVGARTVIGEAGLVAPGLGWAMNGLGFWWTRDGGDHWRTITPPQVHAIGDVVARVVDVAATDDEHIWIAAADIRTGQGWERRMAIERTHDGGKTWQSVIPPGCEDCAGAHLSFVNADTGFALIGARPQPRLFATRDGGATWRRITSNVSFTGPIRFLDARTGWAVSEAAGGGIVYTTRDGGHAWQRIAFAAPQRYRGQPATAGIPHFFDTRNGVVPVRFRDRTRAQHVLVYVTNDDGESWRARAAPAGADLRGESWGFPQALPFSAATMNDWFLLVGHNLYVTRNGGRSWSVRRTAAPKAPHAWDVVFTSPTEGWAIFNTALVKTTDGGRHWSPLAPR